MKKWFVLFLCVVAFSYLDQKNLIPSITQLKNRLISHETEEIKGVSSLPAEQLTENEPTPVSTGKYQTTEIQTYQVAIEAGKIVVTGKPTPYGKYNKANGVLLSIQEVRADKTTTVKVPFTNGEIDYDYPLIYSVGDVVINLDEYYNGKEDDPNKVLGFAQYTLADSDPYLSPSYMIQSDDATITALAKYITNGENSDESKSRAIFEWVAKNVAYNAPLVNAVNPPIYSAVQTYQSRVVLCTGYAHLSAALHRAAGIPAKVSYGENHAWNEVLLNGVWQSEDPTFGSGYINANTNQFVHNYKPAYFSKTDKHKEGEYPW